MAGLILGPLLITLVVSFFEKKGLGISPAFTLESYRLFFTGARLEVLERSFWVALSSTALMLLIAYPIAYLITIRIRPEYTRAFLFLFAAPFLVNYIVRTFAWADLLARTGPVNRALTGLGLSEQPLDWLLFSDFAVYLGLVTAYMPFMIFPIWLSLSGIDRRLLEASWVLGEAPPPPSGASRCLCPCPACSPPRSLASSAPSARWRSRSSWVAWATSCSATPSRARSMCSTIRSRPPPRLSRPGSCWRCSRSGTGCSTSACSSATSWRRG